MSTFINRLGWVIVTAVLVSAFWIFYFGITGAPVVEPEVTKAGEKITLDPTAQPPVTLAEGLWVGPAGLVIPVQGIKPEQLSDTFTQARAGGVRSHDALDIMAPEGTPVVSASDGTVEKLFLSQGGGITAYVRSPDRRWIYYYAHLQGYAPGLAEGQKVKRGQLIGRVGHTGNANPAGPHLHFAINRMEPGERWWQGRPINPYPLLAGKPVKG
ncbi:MAG TPA: M23 family metallopeptidase [Sphingomicrobium sp.]|nr:M23 family metallopeptidase [Sphingomicrobium sp.]